MRGRAKATPEGDPTARDSVEGFAPVELALDCA